MSRLIIKNLPPSITEAGLKNIFSEKGVVTDVQLKYTSGGKFRRFGFVGYETEGEAKCALDYFNNTCIDTAKINVQRCVELGDTLKPKSWSKYAPDSSISFKKCQQPKDTKKCENKNIKNDKKIKTLIEQHNQDPLFNEFLESHSITEVGKLLNDDGNEEDTELDQDPGNLLNHDEDNLNKQSSTKVADEKISDSEYLEKLGRKVEKTDKTTAKNVKLYTVVLRGLGYKHKKQHIKQFFNPLKPKSIRVPPKIKGIAYVGFKTERMRNQALNKHKSFLEGKRIFVYKYDNEDRKMEDVNGDAKNVHWKQQEESLKNEEVIAESGKIFVRNLSYTTTEEDLTNLFEKYGPIAEIDVPIDKVTRLQKGFGTITFMMPEHAINAYNELDGTTFHGRMLHLLPGKTKQSSTEDEKEHMNFKERKEFETKKKASSSHNWNTLFLGQDAVVNAIASNYNTTKENVLEHGGKSKSTAVRIALGETQLVEETKNFLEENGVKLEAFNKPSEKRSKTVILVKNLPYGTKVDELVEKFTVFGILGRVIMPPSGITALVEFLEPSEARKAFNSLSYTKFKNLPLYLEWAPENSLIPQTSGGNNPKSIQDKDRSKEKNSSNLETNSQANDKLTINKDDVSKSDDINSNNDHDEPQPDTTIFVKNLNFTTTSEMLNQHFSKCGKLHYATVTMKKCSKNPEQKLSMGYGFVRYKFKADADKALKELQMSDLEGKTLELKRSERILETDVVSSSRKSTSTIHPAGTKILIKNIPFQANESEITELFKTFGQLKAVRLPKKLVGNEKHRGFGFVEYFTTSDAKTAFKTLSQSTHLYGRRLILEWAQSIEDVDTIRKRTVKHFHQEIATKKRNKATLDPELGGPEDQTE